MTWNNLDEHLYWLLRTKPSQVTSNTLPLAFAGDTSSVVASQQPVVRSVPGAVQGELPRTRDVDSVNTDINNMAKVRVAPGSASKPRQDLESTPQRAKIPSMAVEGEGKQQQRTTSRPILRCPVPSKDLPLEPTSGTSNVIEFMDMTGTRSVEGSSAKTQHEGPRTSRKRKSEELHEKSHKVCSPTTTSRLPTSTSRNQRGTCLDNADIGDVVAEQHDPPPPYSTFKPDCVTPPHGQLDSYEHGPLRSLTSNRWLHEARPDSRGEHAFETVSNFPENSAKRMKTSRGHSLDAISSTRGENLSALPSNSLVAPGLQRSPSRMALCEARTTGEGSTLSSQVLNSSSNPQQPTSHSQDDAALLDKLLLCTEKTIDEILRRLDAQSESVTDAVAHAYDDGDESAASVMLLQLSSLQSQCETINDLAVKRKQWVRLKHERDELFLSMRKAIRIRQGLTPARMANEEGKKRVRSHEIECIALLRTCDPVILHALCKNRIESQERANVGTTLPIAEGPSRCAEHTATTERIAQTQVKHHSHTESFNDPHVHIRDFNGGCNEDTTPMNEQVSQKLELQRREVEVSPSDDVERGRKSLNVLFSTRMGSPSPPGMDDRDDDDYGIDDDDDMIIATEDIENRGKRHQAAVTPLRSAFSELSGNQRPSSLAGQGDRGKSHVHKRAMQDVDDIDARLFGYPWSHDVKAVLRERFRMRGFRDQQLEAINSTLSGKDTFVLMPTGGGKSLCYQLPALIQSGRTRGVTIVVSPLLSLMEDQVNHLRKLHVQAFLLNGETPAGDKKAIMSGLREANPGEMIQLLYVTPEMVTKNQRMMSEFEQLYRRQHLARIVIDEAHCVSQWGHDFRPDYKELGQMRRRFPGVPAIALTATATENVKIDVMHNLAIEGCEVFARSFNRPNLYYEVRPKKGKRDIDDIAGLINTDYPGASGIIYCLSRRNCEDMAKALADTHHIKAHHYHAGMASDLKRQVQRDWQGNKYQVIVATIAFGMGIDKADVRFVIHHNLPKSLEGYYQETGRAGRDGKKSGCFLFYGYQDAGKLRRMIDEGDGSYEQKERQHAMLRKMVQYCENRADCRRVQVLSYFSERFTADDCQSQCDTCQAGLHFTTVDFSHYARQAVALVRSIIGMKMTVLMCIDLFSGRLPKGKDTALRDLEEFGAGAELDRSDVERLFYRLLNEDFVREDHVLNKKSGWATQYVDLGSNSEKVRKAKFEMQVRSTPRPGKTKEISSKAKNGRKAMEERMRSWKETAGSRAKKPREVPPSTNVSSPIQAPSKRQETLRCMESQAPGKGHFEDNLTMSDEDDDYKPSDDESDGFAPVRSSKAPVPPRSHHQSGPPIVSDSTMDDLPEIHRAIVEDFVERAKKKGKDIMVRKSLRKAPFSDTILRTMGIRFTDTLAAMSEIPGIREDMVSLYGKEFCRMVKQCRESYEEMTSRASEDEVIQDPNLQNVIDLVSDDDGDDDEFGSGIGTSDIEAEDEAEQGEASGYFDQPEHVRAFNERFSYSQTEPSMKTSSSRQSTKSEASKAMKKKNYHAKGSRSGASNSWRRRAQQDRNKGISRYDANHVTDKQTARKTSGSRKFAKQGKGGDTGGGGNFSMMPT